MLRYTLVSFLGDSGFVQEVDPQHENTPPVEKVETVIREKNEHEALSRETIVDILIEKSKKFPYNLADKLIGKEKYDTFKAFAMDLFRETVNQPPKRI